MSEITTTSTAPSTLENLLETIRAEFRDRPVWWGELTFRQKVLPVILVTLYWSIFLFFGGFSGDHLSIGLVLLMLSYGSRKLRRSLVFFLPLGLTPIVYNSQRFYSDFIRGPIHVVEPYLFDKTFFGITTPQGILTPNEWWQLHTHPVLDLIGGFFYLTFFLIFIGIAAYFHFWLKRKGTATMSSEEMTLQTPRVMWAFFALNVLGYSTYHWYAAAPPWYVAQYGLGPVDMSAVANAAGCARFDQILGTHFFDQIYGRSADVFGAIPSLHIAYPLLACYYAFKFGAARTIAVIYYVCTCFAAIYFNHHYILDGIWGSAYAILVGVLCDVFGNWRRRSLSNTL